MSDTCRGDVANTFNWRAVAALLLHPILDWPMHVPVTSPTRRYGSGNPFGQRDPLGRFEASVIQKAQQIEIFEADGRLDAFNPEAI